MKNWALMITALLVAAGTAHATNGRSESLVGKTSCELRLERALSGVFVPFDKDPSGFSFGHLEGRGERYIVVARQVDDPAGCKPIIAAMRVDYKLAPERHDSIGLNCAVLDQKFDRHRSYLGIFEANSLEYTRAKVAWVFDFNTEKFASYPKPEHVYCANFIAD